MCSHQPYYFPFSLSNFFYCTFVRAEEPVSVFSQLKKSKKPLTLSFGQVDARLQVKWKPETFYARNSNLLNNNNKSDELFRSQSTIDTNFTLNYGKECFGHPATEFFVTLRNKNIWGNPNSIISTTETPIKLVDFVGGPHRHDITRLVPWIREIWLKFNIGDVLGLSFSHNHYFTLGAFPFELGRGISLGSAYGINPVPLGFYSDNTIDQYAFAFKFSGPCFPTLSYDLYGEIADNKSSTFNQTSEKIRGQLFGFKFDQVRGGGKITYIIASRLRWIPVSNNHSSASFEPYLLYANAPEQRIEINADAESKLGTFGLAAEFMRGNFEFGFDTCNKYGRQMAQGIDRNIVELINVYDSANNGSRWQEVNSHVVTSDPTPVGANLIKRHFLLGAVYKK